ncbi:MAG: hypothetical protein HYZ75_05685 [Elusimicrobia bacterium]|nr:hypothetical protein [Elusimicrobiota bacterium]
MSEETAQSPENVEFKPLKDVGRLPVNETSELRFYVDEFKGYPFGSIRTFVKRDAYAGPTKAGVTLKGAVLDGVIAALETLPKEAEATEDVELGRFPKKPGVELVVRITIYRDATGLDLREWVDEEAYKGWSKRGIRINYPDIQKAAAYLKEMRTFLATRSGPKKAGKPA